MLWDLIPLLNLRFRGTDEERAIADLCVVAFWGLARIGELRYESDTGPLRWDQSLLSYDVQFLQHPKLGKRP
ncbi:hypothetical protein PtB15_15B431 [Puccinia triticina]|nr:hypothetical protein PtB15_15B431 [Puccinia triticina]